MGQATDKFRYRWNNYKACHRRACRGAEVPQKHLHEQFMGKTHQGLENNVEITLIDKTDPSDPTRREDFWIRTLGTMAPKALNMAWF